MALTPPLCSARPLVTTSQHDFASCLIGLTTELQRSLLDEHARILEIHDHKQHTVLVNLRQENRRLRQRLFNETEWTSGDPATSARQHRSSEDDGYPQFPEEMLPDLPEAMKNHRPAHSNGEAPWAHLVVFPATPKATPAASPKVAFVHTQRPVPEHHLLPLPHKASEIDEITDAFASDYKHNRHHNHNHNSNHHHQGEKKTHGSRTDSGLSLTKTKSLGVKSGRSSLFHEQFMLWPEWELVEGDDSIDSQVSSMTHSEESLDYGFVCSATADSAWVDDFDSKDERDSCSKYIISPLSLKVLVWELLGLPLLLYDLLTIPMEAFELPPNAMFRLYISKFIVVYWTFDMFRKFFQGYVSADGTTIMIHQKILYNYLLSHRFVLDLTITWIDWLTVVGFEGEVFEAAGAVRVTKAVRIYRMIRLVRLLRLRKLHKLMNLMQDVVNSAFLSTILMIATNLGLVVGITHCLACLWYLFGTTIGDWFKTGRVSWTSVYFKPEDGWHYRYFTSLHWSICQFTPGSMEVQPKNTVERCFSVIVLIFGMVVFSSFVSSVTNAMAHMQSFSAKYRQQFWLFRRYCRQHSVSDHLVLRVNRYINLVLRPQMGTVQFKDVTLFPLLSEPLYIELLTELHVPQLTSHPFLATLCRKGPFWGMIRKLCCSAVKQDYFSRNDVVFCKGQTSNDMYFVNKGSLRYSFKHGGSTNGCRTSQALHETDWCCEAGLWTSWSHAGTLCAMSECILVLLNSANFRSSCSEYANPLVLVRRYGQLFVKHLVNLQQRGIFISDVPSENSPLETPEIQKLMAQTEAWRARTMGSTSLDGAATLFPGQIAHDFSSHDPGSDRTASPRVRERVEV